MPAVVTSPAAARQAALYSVLTTNAAIVAALHTQANGVTQSAALRKVWDDLAAEGTLVPYVVLVDSAESLLPRFRRVGHTAVERFRVAAETKYHAKQIFGVIQAEVQAGPLTIAGHITIEVLVGLTGTRRDPVTGRALLDAYAEITTIMPA